MSTQNVNVARFARNVKWDFFCDFQTLCFSEKMQNPQKSKNISIFLLALAISFKKLKVEWAIYENWLLLKLFDSMKSNCVSFGFGSTICKYWVHSPFQCSSLLLRRCCSSRASSAHPISVQLHAFWFFVVKSKRTKKSVRSHFSYF